MSADDALLWILIAVGAFWVGQSRLSSGTPQQFFWQRASSGGADGNYSDDAGLVAYRRWVLSFIERSYTLDELHTLAFNIGVNFDRIGGDTITDRGRELIIYCERTGKVGALLEAFNVHRR